MISCVLQRSIDDIAFDRLENRERNNSRFREGRMWRAAFFGLVGIAFALTGGQAAAQPVKIGVLAAFSGPYAIDGGSDLLAGVKDAVARQQAIAGRPIDIIAIDAQATPDLVINSARRLIQQEHVDMLVVGPPSRTVLPLATFIDDTKTLTFTVNLLPERLNAHFMFNLGDTLGGLSDLAMAYAAQVAPKDLPRIDLTRSNVLQNAVREAAQRHGVALSKFPPGTPAVYIALDDTAEDISALHLPTDSIVLGGPRLFGSRQQLDQLKAAGIRAYAVEFYRPPREHQGGQTPWPATGRNGVYLYGVAVVQLYADAVKRAGTLTSDAVAAVLRENRFETDIGTVSFLPGGERMQPSLGLYSADGQLIRFASSSVGTRCVGQGCHCQDGECRSECCPQ
jgi:hypothetical protein